MAVVLSEYGGTSGIVTIEQVVEQIVGEVREELTEAKKEFEVVGEHLYKIEGGMRIDDVNEQLQFDVPEGDYQTIGGFALHLFGHLPKEGEQIAYGDLTLLVADVKENKIAYMFVIKEEGTEEPKDMPV